MPKIMKLTDVGSTEEVVEKYINDDEWVMQQKFDGTRIQLQWPGAGNGPILWSNDGTGAVTHSAAKLKLPALEEIFTPLLEKWFPGPWTIEGELLIRTGEFVIWDMLWDGAPNGDSRLWSDRHAFLVDHVKIMGLIDHELIRLTPTAHETETKAELWEAIKAAGVEGAVSKHIYSTYVPGARTKEWVKHKLVKSADLVVTSANRTFKPGGTVVHKGSAGLAVYDGSLLRPLTSASLIGKDLTIAEGDVVEIEYLYLEPGGAPVQPRIKRKRWDAKTLDGDKAPMDCTFDQFPAYSREVV